MLGLKEHTSFSFTHACIAALDLMTILPIQNLRKRVYTTVSRKELHTARLPCSVTVRPGDGLSLTGALKAFGLLPNLESLR